MTSVALVLGSGGARGLAHIGVIRLLEERGYDIRCIAGSSIGAVIGGIHAAGKLREFEDWVRAISRVDIMTFLDVAWGKGGLMKGDRIINTLIDLVGDVMIEDLPLRFSAVATDLVRQREVLFTRGRLFDAIRASMSVPLLFSPFTLEGVDYIDGGVLNPVPVTAVRDTEADITVAVYCGGTSAMPPKPEPPVSPSMLPAALQEVQEKVRQFMHRFSSAEPREDARDWSTFDVAMQSIEAMQNTIARQKLAAFPPDVLIEIPRNACRTMEYDRAAEMIGLGHHACGEALDR